MKVTVEMHGLEGVLATLQSLPAEIVSKRGGPVRAALRKGANVIAEQARKNAPEDTGALKASIIVTRGKHLGGKKGERYLVRVGKPFKREYVKNRRNIQKGRATQTTAKTYELEELPAIYGRWIEYGTSKMAAKPWLRPAFSAKSAEAMLVAENDLKNSIDKIVKKLARQNRAKK